MSSDYDLYVPEKIIGKSYLKYNKLLEIDLDIIQNNKLTMLNHLCYSPKQIPEGVPSGIPEDIPNTKKKIYRNKRTMTPKKIKSPTQKVQSQKVLKKN